MELKHGDIICCKTEEEAKKLLTHLHYEGYQWLFGGASLLDETRWNKHKEKTSYQLLFTVNQKYIQAEKLSDERANLFTKYQYNELFPTKEIDKKIISSDIAFALKTGSNGLTKSEIAQLLGRMSDEEIFPIELNFDNYDISAIGFISKSAADKFEYNYIQSGLTDFIELYLGLIEDKNNIPRDISFREISIHIEM